MDIPASPPTFSFPRITRRRRHTNAGPAPSLPQQAGGSQPTSQPQDANPLSTTASSLAPIISLVRSSGPFSPSANANATSPTTGPSNSAANHPTSPAMTGPTNNVPLASAPPADAEPGQRIRSFRIRLVPHLESSRSLHFDPIVRDVKVGGPPLRVGRFTDRATGSTRNGNGLSPNDRNSDKVAFRSKVVSRAHAELWAEENGKFFLKDTSSSSGTFINHMRLSPPGQESLAHLLKDGDVIQLGVDYQGGAEEMYRCVKIKVEVGQGREWQGGANAFNTAALKQVRTLQSGGKEGKKTVGDCCICLFPVGVCQSLFIAPCSHAFHYKCIRPMLELHHPGFSCPLCRTFADLEADVEYDPMDEDNENNVIDETIQKLVEAGTRDAAGAENGVSSSGAIVQFLNQPPHEGIQVDSDDDHPNGNRSAVIPSSQVQVDEDEQVEDALEMDYAEEDDDAMASDNSLPAPAAPISVPDEFGGGGASNGNTIESTMTTGTRSQAMAQNNSSVAPVAIGSSRADQAHNDGVNGTTPSNNVLFAGTHPLFDGISPSPESLRITDASSTVPLGLAKDPVEPDFVDDVQRRGVMGGSSGGMDGDLTGTIVGSKRKR